MIPRIDPAVKYVGTTYLRMLNSDKLRGLTGALVVQAENSDPLAVVVPFETYVAIQKTLRACVEVKSVERFSSSAGESALLDAIGPASSSGRGKATIETRSPRQKGDKTR